MDTLAESAVSVITVETLDPDAAEAALSGRCGRMVRCASHFSAALSILPRLSGPELGHLIQLAQHRMARLTGPELEFLAAEGLPRELANRGVVAEAVR